MKRPEPDTQNHDRTAPPGQVAPDAGVGNRLVQAVEHAQRGADMLEEWLLHDAPPLGPLEQARFGIALEELRSAARRLTALGLPERSQSPG